MLHWDHRPPWCGLRRVRYWVERATPSRASRSRLRQPVQPEGCLIRRHVAALLAAALILTAVGPVAAVDPSPSDAPTPAESGPAVDPSPATDPTPTPAAEPSQSGSPAEPPVDASPSEPAANEDAPAATSTPSPAEAPVATTSAADPAGRWIVLYRSGTDAASSSARQSKRDGFKVDRTFTHAAKGFTAKLSTKQAATLRKDPSVMAVVPDEKIELTAQTMPTGVSRIGGTTSVTARIDGIDDRVDADVAIVDTGIAPLGELNVVGGYNCSSTDRTAWRDGNGHGTHVAGTVGALDNGTGVVGVAPGVRLWAVKILNNSGEGLLSWYVCGLDWIAAQRDPDDSSRPLIEAVNMSVTKWGSDDRNCGLTNADILHQSICRLVSSGVTVVAAAANVSGNAAYRVPASYDEVITVSALADTDGRSGGLGGHRCYSWGSYDADDTFANFSNYGSDVDLIAPGKCIWSTVPNGYQYMSGTSMAAPHVTGAVALLKASRPAYSPFEVKQALQALGNLNWKVATDPDNIHEKLLDVSRLGPPGDFSVSVAAQASGEAGGGAKVAVGLTRSSTYFDRVDLKATSLPSGFSASFDRPSLIGFTGTAAVLTLSIPSGTTVGTYHFTVVGTDHGTTHSAGGTVTITRDNPTASAPRTDASPKTTLGIGTIYTRLTWPAATDPSSAIGGYELQASVDGGAWGPTTSIGPTVLAVAPNQLIGHAYQYRMRARDVVGNWSPWVAGPAVRSGLAENNSRSVVYGGRWTRYAYKNASGGSASYATAKGASAKLTFRGRAIAIVAPVGPTRGSARIYVDGVYRGTVSFRLSTNRSRRVVYTTTLSSLGTHSIQLRLSGNGRIDLDTFVVYR